MKRYLAGIIGILIAITTVAFTEASKAKNSNSFDSYYFKYIGFSNSGLSSPYNWQEVFIPPYDCDQTNETVCYVRFWFPTSRAEFLEALNTYYVYDIESLEYALMFMSSPHDLETRSNGF